MYNLAVRNRCRLLDINRSNFYYKSRIDISKINSLCKDIHNIWSKYQYFGYRRITEIINQDRNHNNKILLMCELPGVPKKNCSLNYSNNILRISGSTNHENEWINIENKNN